MMRCVYGKPSMSDTSRSDCTRVYPEHPEKWCAICLCRRYRAALLALEALQAEHDRLKRGDFSREEIHEICHNLHGTVNPQQFADGCAAEQRKLYGCAPDADALLHLRSVP